MSAADHDGQPGIFMPDARAPHAEWLAYAVSQGMPADMARGMTRTEIQVRLTEGAPGISGEPDLERFERDPETAAVLREARRQPRDRA